MLGRGFRSRLRRLRRWRVTRQTLQPTSSSKLFARAYPESVSIEEHFHYTQEVSRNRTLSPDGTPKGQLRVRLPYDGFRYFTRAAHRDVLRGIRGKHKSSRDVDAIIGHLVVTNFQDTNIADVLEFSDRYGVVPLQIPVFSAELKDAGDAVSDRYEYRFDADYAPTGDQPKLIPIQLDVELEDPDNADLPEIDAETDPKNLDNVASKIMDYVGFRPEIRIGIHVNLTLPPQRGRPPRAPTVRRVAVELPTITSLAPSSLRLALGDRDIEVQHNPDNRSIEWFETETRPNGHADEGEPWQFTSGEMLMTIDQPGELFARDDLTIEVEVEVPGVLLSGMEARLFNAQGRLRRGTGARTLRVRSLLTMRCNVVLRDAFARRQLSPYQSFHFDEVIPEELRVADIATALRDQRFDVTPVDLGSSVKDAGFRHFLFANRTEGPDTMNLWVFVHGRRYTTERRSRHGGGDTYKSIFETGDVRLVVRGRVRRDSVTLIHDVNELQLALRDRFRRLKAPR